MLSPLAAYLSKNKISHAAFARKLKVTDSAVWRWAHGMRRPSLEAAFGIERVTGGAVTAADLLRRRSPRSRVA